MKKKVISAFLAAAMVISLTAGCASSSETKSDNKVSQAPADSVEESGAAPEGQTVVSGGTTDVINVGINGDPTDLDPFSSITMRNGMSQPLFYQTLGYLNEDGSFAGVMMELYEIPDNKTIQVKLYENIVDQAGNPFTAADAVWCLQKYVETQNRYTTNVESAEQTGDYTFTIHSKNDFYMSDISDLFINIWFVTRASYEASADHMQTTPVSTAPYKVAEYVPGSSITLEVWDGYWKKDDQIKTPIERQNAKKINYYIILEKGQMSIALETGTIDIAQSVALDDVGKFSEGSGFTTYTVAETLMNCLFPNTSSDSACNDPLVRDAIYYAIDGAAIVNKIFGKDAVTSKAVGSPVCPDYNPDWASSDYWNYNPEKAKELLAQAGYDKSNPLHLELLVLEHPTFSSIMEIVHAYLTAIGIDANLTVAGGGNFFATAADSTKWDLMHCYADSAGYVTTAWASLRNNYSSTGPIGFEKDDILETLIAKASTVSTHNQENVNAAYDYIKQMGYAYGLSTNYVNIVYNSDKISDFILSDHKWIAPNACTYAK